ncbi:MAG TPA: hypothetical protein VGK48_19210 [Terriglobia bacterium]|jgi:hypothetical protein
MDRLSPETRREIDRQMDSAAQRTAAVTAALLRYAKRALWIVPLLIIVAFLADYVTFRASGQSLGTVSVRRYYTVGLKNGKTEFYYVDPENQTCANSIFPHLGYSPCWYLRRHNTKEISI